MPALEWFFKLNDRMSGASSQIERQLTNVSRALKTLDMQARATRLEKTIDPLKRQRLELQLQRDKLLLSKRALEEHGRASDKTARSWSDSLLRFGASLYIIESIGRAFGFVAEKAADMAREIRAAVAVRESAMIGIRAAVGGGRAEGVFGQLEKMQTQYGRPGGQLVNMGRDLLAAGMPQGELGPTIAAIEDVRAAGPAGGADKLLEAVKSILTRPTIRAKQLIGGLSGVLDTKRALSNVSAFTGIKPGDLDVEMSANRVQDKVAAIRALQATSAQQYNEPALGSKALEFADTLEGKIGRISALIEKMWTNVEKSRGFRQFKGVLDNIISVLGEGKTGGLLVQLANTLGDVIKPLTGAEGRKKMEEFFESMAAGAKKALGVLGDVAEKVGQLQQRFFPSDDQKRSAMNEALSKDPSQRFTIGNRQVTPEEYFGLPPMRVGSGDVQVSDRGMNARDPRWDTPSAPAPVPRSQAPARPGPGKAEVHVHVRVDARGATKDDAHEIAQKIADVVPTRVADVFDQMATEQGAQ